MRGHSRVFPLFSELSIASLFVCFFLFYKIIRRKKLTLYGSKTITLVIFIRGKRSRKTAQK